MMPALINTTPSHIFDVNGSASPAKLVSATSSGAQPRMIG